MNCQTYIFKLSSGQLAEPSPFERLQGATHYMTCRRCRAFTRNNAALDAVLRAYRVSLTGESQ